MLNEDEVAHEDEEASKEFGQEIRRRRIALELTLPELAERSGLSPNYIGAIELGQRDPSLSTIRALARGLGVMPGELLGMVPNLSAAAIELAMLVDGQDPAILEALLQIARAGTKKRRGKTPSPG